MSLPERLGRLRRVERLGSGGFATVWRYHDEDLASDVAVKALADNWSQRLDIRDRFLEEARILRQADSDHLVRVYDIGETTDGTPYFVMSYADRGTVADLVAGGRTLPPAQTVDLLEQAALGLDVLHRGGIVHRDVKPQNLLLRTGHRGVGLLVADLGVAKAAAHASALTAVVGTPAYMAPEQAWGSGVDVRADVHALAAVGYLLLTGRPVRGDGLGGLMNPVLPTPPSSYVRVPPGVETAVMTGLAPDREDRWPDVGSFVTALRDGLAGRPVAGPVTIAAPGPGAPTVGRGPAGSPPRGGGVTALLVLLVLVVTFGAAFGVTLLVR